MVFRTFIPRVPAPMSRIGALATSAIRLAHTQAPWPPSLLAHPRTSSRAHSHPHQAQSSSKARVALRTIAPFSTTAHRRADKFPEEDIYAIQMELWKVMMERPEVLKAVQEYMQLVTDCGIIHPGRIWPADLTLDEFQAREDVQENSFKMVAAFREAGIDITPKEMVVALMGLQLHVNPKYLG
ncbi:hypothetical protein LXA43DRAFT_501759 [Ganoderma leucocontextum]|nr:hypothetical protein LXA43DRAFT_501759 [Ganoderma leucocontextum]